MLEGGCDEAKGSQLGRLLPETDLLCLGLNPYSINMLYTFLLLYLCSRHLLCLGFPLGCLNTSSVLNHGSNPLHSLKSEAEFSKLQPAG